MAGNTDVSFQAIQNRSFIWETLSNKKFFKGEKLPYIYFVVLSKLVLATSYTDIFFGLILKKIYYWGLQSFIMVLHCHWLIGL